MLTTLLNAADSIKGDGEAMSQAVIQAVLGQMVTFIGIVILIAILAIVAVIIKNTVGKEKDEKKVKAPKNQVKPAPDKKPERSRYAAPEPVKAEDDIPAEVKAAIIAAISAYYYTAEKPHAEFTVKRIKRI